MEAARSWLGVTSPALPTEVAAALASHPAFGTVVSWSAEPEVRLPFDQHRGEPRNTDLLVQARDRHGDFLVAVEAKADESFGETVAQALAAAAERKLLNPRSSGIERIEQLTAALFGPRRKDEASLTQLRYQLLTATAGAVAAATRSHGQRVVFLIQEFRTPQTIDKKHLANGRDLDAFAHRLSHGVVPRIASGTIHGPFGIPGGTVSNRVPSLFIGKVTCELRAPEA